MSGPAPARMASRCERSCRSVERSMLRPGSNGVPKPGRQPRTVPSPNSKMLVFNAVKPLCLTSAPIASTPARSRMAGG